MPLVVVGPAAEVHGGAVDRRAAGVAVTVPETVPPAPTGVQDGKANEPMRVRMVQAVDRVVFVRVPERAAVGVERHGAVVAPADAGRATAVAGLRAGALNEQLLGLAERVDGIGRQPAGVLDRRVGRAARGAVAHGHVARPVDGEAGHEAVDDVRAVRVPRRGLRQLAATVPPVTSTWYQRGRGEAASCCPGARCGLAHSDSTPPMFVYWFCTIARI